MLLFLLLLNRESAFSKQAIQSILRGLDFADTDKHRQIGDDDVLYVHFLKKMK